jgi:hypothetical protein
MVSYVEGRLLIPETAVKSFSDWIDAKPHRFPLMLVIHTALLAAILAAPSCDLTTVVTRVALASTTATSALRSISLARRQEVPWEHGQKNPGRNHATIAL